MTVRVPLCTVLLLLAMAVPAGAQDAPGTGAVPPFGGTIFVDPDIITAQDPSAYAETTYAGRGRRTVFDRRRNRFVTMRAYVFRVRFRDGLRAEGQVNPEFGSVAAARREVVRYAKVVGRLPRGLRVEVEALWIHRGDEDYGGGNDSLLIHTGRTAAYEEQGILEETLVHEATHTSIDGRVASSAAWRAAQRSDPRAISTYARDNPAREDVAETLLLWFAVRFRAARLDPEVVRLVTSSVPARLRVLDRLRPALVPLRR